MCVCVCVCVPPCEQNKTRCSLDGVTSDFTWGTYKKIANKNTKIWTEH